MAAPEVATSRPIMPNRQSLTVAGSVGGKKKNNAPVRRQSSFNRFFSNVGQSSRKLMSTKNKSSSINDGNGDTNNKTMRRSDSLSSWGSLSNHGSNHGSRKKKVKFESSGRSKKITPEIHEFPKVDNKADVWWTKEEMEGIVDGAKKTIDDFAEHCERYRKVLDKVIQRCGSTPTTAETVQFDMKVIKKFVDAKARGLEHHVCPEIVRERQKIIKNVTACQKTMVHAKADKKQQLLAQRYASLSHGNKLLAKTMAEGDAMVAKELAAEA